MTTFLKPAASSDHGATRARSRPVRTATIALTTFAIAVASGEWLRSTEFYSGLLRALPDYLRWSEQPIRWIILCVLGVMIAHRVSLRAALVELRFNSPVRPALWFNAVALLPMILAGLLLGRLIVADQGLFLIFTATLWPLGEEVLFRAYAFHQLHRRAGWNLWAAAVTTGVLFGALHLLNAAVQGMPLIEKLGTVAIIGGGGIIFAWFFARWHDNLWVPLGLHGGMNLCWALFDMADNPLGGWGANGGRILTALTAIVVTKIYCRPGPSPERPAES